MRRIGRKQDMRGSAERLVGSYADMILRLSYTYLGSTADAEDICQEVLLNCETGILFDRIVDLDDVVSVTIGGATIEMP